MGDDQNDIIDFDTGNEFSSTLNRDILNAQQRANMNLQGANDLNLNNNPNFIENRFFAIP